MPSSGDGTGWDETLPTDSGLVSDTGLEIRDLRKGVRIRANKEHVDAATTSAGGEHEAGSAKGYFQNTFPTKRPDGATDLGSGDGGRFLVRSDTGALYYWDSVAGAFALVKAVDATQFADGIISGARVASGFMATVFKYAVVTDTKTNNTDAGQLQSGAWRTRDLNTITLDNGSIITSVAANQVTLPAGTYRFRASCPAYKVDGHRCRIRDVTNGITFANGSNARAAAADDCVTESVVIAERTLVAPVAIEVQHQCVTTKASNGAGVALNFGDSEVYTRLEIWKLA